MDALLGRIRAMIGRAIVGTVDDATTLQSLQVELLDGEVQDAAERFQDYGFVSVPHAEAEAVMAAAGGLRSHALVLVVADRRYRLTGLAAGEVAMHDDQGQKVHLTRDGIVIETDRPVTVRAASLLVEAEAVDLGGAGGANVARVGDTVTNGVITSGSDRVKSL